MAEEKEEVVYTKPTSQLDLEARMEDDEEGTVTVPQMTNPSTPEEGENLYIGTDPIYQNHASDTEAPRQSQEGGEQKAEEKFLAAYDKPELNLKRRKALEEGDDQETLDKPLTDRVTARASTLFGEDPGSGEGSGEEADGPDEEEVNEKPSASPTSSSTGQTPARGQNQPSSVPVVGSTEHVQGQQSGTQGKNK